MIKKFWCWLWGHDNVVNVLAEARPMLSAGGLEVMHFLYRPERLDFCLRCGVRMDE